MSGRICEWCSGRPGTAAAGFTCARDHGAARVLLCVRPLALPGAPAPGQAAAGLKPLQAGGWQQAMAYITHVAVHDATGAVQAAAGAAGPTSLCLSRLLWGGLQITLLAPSSPQQVGHATPVPACKHCCGK